MLPTLSHLSLALLVTVAGLVHLAFALPASVEALEPFQPIVKRHVITGYYLLKGYSVARVRYNLRPPYFFEVDFGTNGLLLTTTGQSSCTGFLTDGIPMVADRCFCTRAHIYSRTISLRTDLTCTLWLRVDTKQPASKDWPVQSFSIKWTGSYYVTPFGTEMIPALDSCVGDCVYMVVKEFDPRFLGVGA